MIGSHFFIQRIISIYDEMCLLWSEHVTRHGIGKHNNLQMQRMWFKQFDAKGHSLIFEAPPSASPYITSLKYSHAKQELYQRPLIRVQDNERFAAWPYVRW